jgi:hypothetical protein
MIYNTGMPYNLKLQRLHLPPNKALNLSLNLPQLKSAFLQGAAVNLPQSKSASLQGAALNLPQWTSAFLQGAAFNLPQWTSAFLQGAAFNLPQWTSAFILIRSVMCQTISHDSKVPCNDCIINRGYSFEQYVNVYVYIYIYIYIFMCM